MRFFEIVEIKQTCRFPELRGKTGYVASLPDESGTCAVLVYDKREVFCLSPSDLILTDKIDEEEIAFRQRRDSRVRVAVDPSTDEGRLVDDDEL